MWQTILLFATNISTLAVVIVTAYFRIRTIKNEFDSVKDHLHEQDKIAATALTKIESVGRHADIRYIERRSGAQRRASDANVDTAEQIRLRKKWHGKPRSPPDRPRDG